jgi:flagellar biosynthesis GTPase FlhF
MELPRDFVAIKDVVPGTVASFIGILTDITVTFWRTGSWQLEFTVYDGLTAASFDRKSAIRCQLNRPGRDDLPVGAVNDPVLIRNINVITYNGFLEAQASRSAGTEISFFPANQIPQSEYSAPYGSLGGASRLPCNGTARRPHTPDEQLAIINIKALAATSSALRARAMQSSVARTPHAPSSTGNPRNKKDCLLKDVQVGRFCNLTVEVVKCWDSGNDTIDLFVTDYTTNKDFFDYEDPNHPDAYSYAGSSTWKGPYGQVTMSVRLWEPHTSRARAQVGVGDLIFLSNVHIKWSQANRIEGALHQDKKFPEKFQIRKISNREQIAALAARKEAYLGAQDRQDAHQPHQPKKASAKKSAKKKEERRARERQEREAEQRELEKKLEEEAASKANLNQHSK